VRRRPVLVVLCDGVRLETGRTPVRFVEQVRLESAQHQLELRRAFARGLGVTPSDYRARFRTTGIG
jgi:transcriptional regulator GlxA family with amidase domain